MQSQSVSLHNVMTRYSKNNHFWWQKGIGFHNIVKFGVILQIWKWSWMNSSDDEMTLVSDICIPITCLIRLWFGFWLYKPNKHSLKFSLFIDVKQNMRFEICDRM